MIDCTIIQDLLPLYADGCCSEETRRLVDAHLHSCAACRDLLRQMQGELPAPEAAPAERERAQTMKSGMKKIRRRWLASLLAVVVLMGIGKITWNQVRGVGLYPTNLNEHRICNAFLKKLVQEDYEGAYRYFDLDSIRTDWQEWNFPDEKMDALETNGLTMFLSSAAALKDAGLTDFKYLRAYRTDGAHMFYYTVTVDKKSSILQIVVSDQGIAFVHGGNGYLPDPDALTQMSLWREYLWQDYSGCRFDWNSHQYIYGETP